MKAPEGIFHQCNVFLQMGVSFLLSQRNWLPPQSQYFVSMVMFLSREILLSIPTNWENNLEARQSHTWPTMIIRQCLSLFKVKKSLAWAWWTWQGRNSCGDSYKGPCTFALTKLIAVFALRRMHTPSLGSHSLLVASACVLFPAAELKTYPDRGKRLQHFSTQPLELLSSSSSWALERRNAHECWSARAQERWTSIGMLWCSSTLALESSRTHSGA